MDVKKWGFLFFFIILLAACNGDSRANETEEQDVLRVYTTIFPLEDFSKKIGGNHVTVTNLIPVGADAHTFEPTPKDLIDVANGDVFIYNGAGLESFAEKLEQTLEGEGVTFVKAAQQIEQQNSDPDPHVWLDPILAISLAEAIKEAFIELMPEREEVFTENFQTLKTELEQLDEEFRSLIAQANRDTIFVTHAGYSYWEERYGIKQIGIMGTSPTNEPSQRELKQIIELAKAEDVNYILMERNVQTNVTDVVLEALDAEMLYLYNLESIYEEERKNGEDYFSLMRKNIDTLQKALE